MQDPEDWCSFVIDGHHKLEAYRRAARPARFITIQRLWNERYHSVGTGEYFEGLSKQKSDYNRLKTRIGQRHV